MHGLLVMRMITQKYQYDCDHLPPFYARPPGREDDNHNNMIKNIMIILLLSMHGLLITNYDQYDLLARPPDHEDDNHKNMIKNIKIIFLLPLHARPPDHQL